MTEVQSGMHFVLYASGRGRTAMTEAMLAVLQKSAPRSSGTGGCCLSSRGGGGDVAGGYRKRPKVVRVVCNKAARGNSLVCMLPEETLPAGLAYVLCRIRGADTFRGGGHAAGAVPRTARCRALRVRGHAPGLRRSAAFGTFAGTLSLRPDTARSLRAECLPKEKRLQAVYS